MATKPGLVVVGVAGTPSSQAALNLAMREAWLRSSTLLVITAWRYDIDYDTLTFRPPFDVAAHAQEAQEAAISSALSTSTEPPTISRRVIEGEAGLELVLAAHGADLLVVGSTSKSAVERAVMGSVSQFCLRHATCPVVVVPAEKPAHGRFGQTDVAGAFLASDAQQEASEKELR